jgi:hypothetical protein
MLHLTALSQLLPYDVAEHLDLCVKQDLYCSALHKKINKFSLREKNKEDWELVT